jgi:hypothetical protein
VALSLNCSIAQSSVAVYASTARPAEFKDEARHEEESEGPLRTILDYSVFDALRACRKRAVRVAAGCCPLSR